MNTDHIRLVFDFRVRNVRFDDTYVVDPMPETASDVQIVAERILPFAIDTHHLCVPESPREQNPEQTVPTRQVVNRPHTTTSIGIVDRLADPRARLHRLEQFLDP